ncbi:MAG: DNA repair protein rad52 [Chrysothrix sp. TS-e1954]|nr:MAG: DNA repair protein rad52 [Chrysothrix sp. TS-e1954]
MPAQTELNRDIKNEFPNPFEEVTPHVNEFTAKEIVVLQNRLDKQLGPEYISSRPGAGGAKVHYIAADKVINLANEVFGFNGWSSELREQKVDFCDLYENSKVSLGVSTVVRVSLKDGTFHEDVGYGHIENCKGKAAAFEKAKKESATDALKRALRNFGKVLGNCLYDKDYLNRVTKLRIAPARWDAQNLHRHPDFAPIKPQSIADHDTEQRPPGMPHGPDATSSNTEHEDEFGGNLFDEVEMPGGGNPDEVMLHDRPDMSSSVRPEPQRRVTDQAQAYSQAQVSRPPPPRRNVTVAEGQMHQALRNDGRMPPPSRVSSPAGRQPNIVPRENHNAQQQQNDTPTASPNDRISARAAINPNTAHQSPSHNSETHNGNDPPPSVGFITSRNAALLTAPEPPGAGVVATLPRFDPASDSPSIRKTSGINHAVSRPLLRQAQQIGAQGDTSVRHTETGSDTSRPAPINYVNPSADVSRRIGMPSGAASPHSNRSAYKPPGPAGVKRPPLAEVTNTIGQACDSTEPLVKHEECKKVRLEET